VARRLALKVPLRVRAWKQANGEKSGESLNISASGIYFACQSPLREGETVEVLFQMPKEVTGEPPVEWRCTGHVVRVASAGVAVRFDCYEVARAKAVEEPVQAGWPMREIALGAR
jgi:hypothetical protein